MQEVLNRAWDYLTSSSQPTPWYYLGFGIFVILLAAASMFLTWKTKRSSKLSKPRRDFWKAMKTALGACALAELLIVLSIWLGLPTLGTRSSALVVAGLLIVWLIGIAMYYLLFYPAKLRQTHRAQSYTKYIPS